MTSFDFLWQLLEGHGAIPNYKADCARLWDTFSLEQQRAIYRSIRDKLRAGQFVNYNPVLAIKENTPRRTQLILSYNDYYRRYGTDAERDGWKRVFLPEKHTTIYVKE